MEHYSLKNTSLKGKEGEARAAAFLRKQGFTILRRNFMAPGRNEIDIIARDATSLIFVEVKSRSGSAFGGAHYAISKGQLQRMRRAAHYFLQISPRLNLICRFDLIALENGGLTWITDIIR